MAIFNPSIYKDISGSVGNVTSYKIGKTQIARAKTRFMKDAKTPKQLQQRARLRLITRLRRNFIAILKTGYCTSSGKTCTNCFTRDNIGKVNAEDWDHPTLDLLTLSLSDGNLRLPLMEAEVNAEKRLVAFRWKKQPLMPHQKRHRPSYNMPVPVLSSSPSSRRLSFPANCSSSKKNPSI